MCKVWTNCSYIGMATSGRAARMNEGRLPFLMLAWRVNWLHEAFAAPAPAPFAFPYHSRQFSENWIVTPEFSVVMGKDWEVFGTVLR